MDLAKAIPSTQDTLSEKTKNLHVIDDKKTWWDSTYLLFTAHFGFVNVLRNFIIQDLVKKNIFPQRDILSDGD